MLAEVGPATLTADPRLFQRRLRELHVQVGVLSPAALLHGWLGTLALGGKPVPAWWCVVGSIPALLWDWCPPGVWQGLRAELGLLEADHSGLGAGRGWVTLVLCPGAPAMGQSALSSQLLSQSGNVFPGRVCTDSLWNQRSLLLEVLSENCLSFFI